MDVLRQRELDRLRAVAGLGDDLEVGRRVEHHAQAVADDLVVVREQDARLQRDGHDVLVVRSGSSAAPRSPASGDDSIDSLPPTSSARSRMPGIPAVPRGSSRRHALRRRLSTASVTLSASAVSDTVAVAGPEWRSAFVRPPGRPGRSRARHPATAAAASPAAPARCAGRPGRSIRVQSAISAFTSPRSSSASGRSSRAMRRTSSRLSRTPSATPRSASRRQLRVPVRGALGLDRHRREGLPDLVVELARHPQPLGLLCGERGARRLVPSVSSLSSMALKACAMAWPSTLRSSTSDSRRPGVRVNRRSSPRSA